MAENSLAGLVNFISKIWKSEWESSKWLTSEFARKTTITGGTYARKGAGYVRASRVSF